MARPEIERFWSWWDQARHEVERAIESGEWGTLTDEVTERVHAIDPDLDWEFSQGDVAEHALSVTAGGVSELRSTAERWHRAAPPPDATWEYHAARRADLSVLDGGMSLQVAGRSVDPADVTLSIEVDTERRLVDVAVHHPIFAEVPQPARAQVTFLVLDWLLGEDGVERWLGTVGFEEDPPEDAVDPRALVAAVAELASEMPEVSWALLSGTDPQGWPVLITARQPMGRTDHPLFDLRGSITVPYRAQSDNGLPELDELDRLAEVEQALVEAVGSEAVLAAVVSRRGERTMHLYADADGPAPTLVEAWSTLAVGEAADGGVEVTWELDPAWSEVRRFA